MLCTMLIASLSQRPSCISIHKWSLEYPHPTILAGSGSISQDNTSRLPQPSSSRTHHPCSTYFTQLTRSSQLPIVYEPALQTALYKMWSGQPIRRRRANQHLSPLLVPTLPSFILSPHGTPSVCLGFGVALRFLFWESTGRE
jgi:hypothetical protein